MKVSSRGLAVMAVIIVACMFMAGCTPENTLVKKRDYRDVTAGDDRDGDDYEEEINDLDGGEKGGAPSDRRNAGKKEADGDEDGTYKKSSYYQTGMASWYGREFHGKKTASGERFDMGQLTAAHKTLPFGTVVRVKNFENGKSVTVRINDRGPYRGARIIDLSHGAAKKLDMLKDGQTRVGIQIVGKGGSPDAEDEEGGRNGFEAVSDDREGAEPGRYAVQAGAFYSRRNAENLKSRIEDMTDDSVVIIQEADMYKVRVEGLSSRSAADRFKKKLTNEDIPSFIVNDGK